MKDNILIILCKYPEMGNVKTRIAKTLGETFAFELYNAFLEDVFSVSNNLDSDKIIALNINECKKFEDGEINLPFEIINQEGKDIGERMYNAFIHAFSLGYKRAVLIGSDIPDITEDLLHNSFQSLEKNNVILGKSGDGGYYLIGFQADKCNIDFFKGIPWSTSNVFIETYEKIKLFDYSLSLSPVCFDIDFEADLAHYFYRNLKKNNLSSQTMKYLLQCVSSGTLKL